jgi:hypothetical protein
MSLLKLPFMIVMFFYYLLTDDDKTLDQRP